MKHYLYLATVLFCFNEVTAYPACTPGANDNCANAQALVVNAAAVDGTTCGSTLQTGELTDCAPEGTNQSVWYSFVATASEMAVVIIPTSEYSVSSSVWPASDGCPATSGCHPISCQDGEEYPDSTVHVLNNLTVGNTYEVQVMYESGFPFGAQGTFDIRVSTTVPANPTNPVALSTCSNPSGPMCVFNTADPTVTQVTSTCQFYGIPDSTVNDVVKSCFTFSGEYSTDITFNFVISTTCGARDPNVTWFGWELYDSSCAPVGCGNDNTAAGLNYDGIKCGESYVACYYIEVPDCIDDGWFPYISAVPPAFTVTPTSGSNAATICKGESVNMTANAAGYVSYIWNPTTGLNTSTGGSVTASPDTTTAYTVTGYDSGGCSQIKTVTITVKPGVNASIVPATDSITCTQPNLTLTASGGGTYAWSTTATTSSIAVISANTYTVTVTLSGCSATASSIITGNTTKPLAAVNPPLDTLTCANNSVNLTASGGGTYAWSTNVNTPSIIVTTANTYTVTVTGSNACTATASASVISSAVNVSATTSSVSAGCTATGSATVTPTVPGTYTYLWSNNGTTQTISNLAAGNYTVTITANTGCTGSASATVGATGNGISANLTVTNADCTPDGSVSANPSGATTYTYLWSDNATTQTISNLAIGNYSVTVTGNNGCSTTASAAVVSSGSPIGLSPSSTPATCGNDDGSASVTATSGTGPFTYSWSNNQTTQSISNAAGGNYTVTVNGAGGCSSTISINISITGGLTVSASSSATTCGSSNGSASASVAAGNGPYTYSWSNNSTSDTLSNVASGNYLVTVTGSGGCTGAATVNVAASSAVSGSITPTGTTCGNSNGSATVNASGGGGTYSYFWSNSATTQTIGNLSSGNYSVTITSGNCSAEASTTVNPSGDSIVTITSSKNIMCPGDSSQICAPNGYLSYYWNNGDTADCFYTTLAGNYYLTVTDNGHCQAQSNTLSLQVYPNSPVELTINGDSLISYNATSYQWILNGTPIVGATSSVYVAQTSGNYSLQITDANGCIATSSIETISISGIKDLSENHISVYPNPTSDSWWLSVTYPLTGVVIEVFDATGRQVYNSIIRSQQSEIIIPGAARGIYELRIIAPQFNYTSKLVKM